MKKHIVGLMLFTFIVGASAIIFGFFNVPEILEVSAPRYFSKSYEKPAQIGKISADSPVIRQAFFNRNTKQINLDLLLNSTGDEEGRLPLKISFFRKSENGMRFVGSEKVELISASYQYEGEKVRAAITASYIWLDNLNHYDNLYVIAEVDRKPYNSNEPSIFDARFAKAVTLYAGKR